MNSPPAMPDEPSTEPTGVVAAAPPKLTLQSERYQATGNLASEGVQNQLGRPRLDQLTVLVREAVQNSSDAADPAQGGVRFDIDLREASSEQRQALREYVFAESPDDPNIHQVLTGERPVLLLTLSDRGTSGLGGLTRADQLPEEGEEAHQDFIDFLRNIGQPPDKPGGGGTFGYGKAALYRVSHQHTILVYTRCRHQGRLQSRLMGAALGPGYTRRTEDESRGRYTGRHWWGRPEGGIVEPLLDEQADRLARMLGMPGFQEGECGTSILILDFNPGLERTAEEAMGVMVEAALWNCWPRMVADRGRVPIRFSARLNGTVQPVGLTPPLDAFARALEAARCVQRGESLPSDFNRQVVEVECRNPRKRLGWLVLQRMLRPPQTPPQTLESVATGRPAICPAHHVALMRGAELVVRYEEGPPLQSDLLEYVGVFVASSEPEVDRAFANSEPPTHDDWVSENLDDPRKRTFVKMGLQRIREGIRSFVEPVRSEPPATQQVPLGALSSVLGELLKGLPGPGGNRAELSPQRKARAQPVVEDPGEEETVEPTADPTVEPPGLTPPTPTDEPTGASDRGGEDPGPIGSTAPKDPPRSPRPTRLIVGRPRIRTSTARLDVLDGVPLLLMDIHIQHGKNSLGTRLAVDARAVIEGGDDERSPPVGADLPQVHLWRKPDGSLLPATGASLDVPPGEEGQWMVGVRLIDDAEVRVTVQGEALQPG